MNIVKILRKLRETQSLIKYLLLDPEIYRHMRYMKQNTINLSSSEEEDEFDYKENQKTQEWKIRFQQLRANK